MNNIVKIIITLLWCFIFIPKTTAQEPKPITKDSLVNLVETYYELNLKVFQSNSTLQDIDNVFTLFTNDFTYMHPRHGGNYTREKLYQGYVRNQEKGGYDGSIVDIKIVNMITGLDAVTVERKHIKKTDNGNQDGEYEMTLFEFKKGKISKIFEYW